MQTPSLPPTPHTHPHFWLLAHFSPTGPCLQGWTWTSDCSLTETSRISSWVPVWWHSLPGHLGCEPQSNYSSFLTPQVQLISKSLMHPLSPTSSPTFTSDSDLHLPWRWVPQLPRYCLLCFSASNPLAWSDSSSLRILLWLWQSSAQKPSRAPLCLQKSLPTSTRKSDQPTRDLPAAFLVSRLPPPLLPSHLCCYYFFFL